MPTRRSPFPQPSTRH